MARLPTTRFYVDVGNQLAELFSVRERKDDSLLILPKTSQFYEVDGALDEFREDHYSVHLSENSPGTTITRKTTLASGTLISSAAFIPDSKDKMLWGIFARRPPALSLEQYKLRSRPRDALVKCASYQPKFCSLLYSVFCTTLDFSSPAIKEAGLESISVDFQRFKIIVIPSYFGAPSLDTGDVITSLSAPPRINGEPMAEPFPIQVRSLPYETIVAQHHLFVNSLSFRFQQRLLKMLWGDPEMANLAIRLSARVFYSPIDFPADDIGR